MNKKPEQHIIRRYDEELEHLRSHVCEMGELVLGQLCLSLESLRTGNLELAQETIRREQEVNQFEITMDTEIFNILAKRSPIASDLRFVMASSRVVNALERIGDDAAKIANYVLYLYSDRGNNPGLCPLDNVFKMGKTTTEMLRTAVSAFEKFDESAAQQILVAQNDLTQTFKTNLHWLMTRTREEGHNIVNSVNVGLMLKALEKIGGHVHNIAENIIFQVSGQDFRVHS